MQLRLFGPVSLRDQSGADPAGGVPQPKRIALLAYLALARGEFIRRDTLLALFWPDATEKDARGALNQAVHYLRRVVGADFVTSGGAETLAVSRRLWCDVLEFDDAVRDGRHQAALELYRGHLMDGFYLSDLPEFEQWLNSERARRARQAADASWMISEASLGVPATALEWAARAHDLCPDEGATRRLMRLHGRLDDRAGAIRIYDEFARKLRVEYGAEPAEATQGLLAEIRDGSIANRPLRSPAGGVVSRATATISAPRSPRLGRRTIGFVAAGAVAGIAVLATLGNAARSRNAPSDAGLVAVMPFAYHGLAEHEYLREGVASLLATNLAGAGELRTVDPGAVFGAIARVESPQADSDVVREVAESFGAGSIVTGDMTIAAGRVRLTATLERLGGTPPERVVAEGRAEEIFQVVDDLAARLVVRSAGQSTYSTAAATTHSIAALKAYMKGDADYRAGHYASAVDALKRAVAIDSTFALAHYRLSTAANWTGDQGATNTSHKMAYRLRDRLSPNDRAKVEAWDFLQRSVLDSAISAYERIIATKPSDVDAAFHLADLRFHNGAALGHPLRESGAEWSRVLALDPGHAGAILHAARVAAIAGDRARFDSLAAQAARLEVDVDRAVELQMLHAFAFGDRADRTAAISALDGVSEPVRRDVLATSIAASPTLTDVPELIGSRLANNSFASREDGQMLVRAQVELAAGRLRSMASTIDSTALLHAGHAREFRALFASLAMPAASPGMRRAIAAELSSPGKPYPRGEENRLYLLGLLAVRNGDSTGAWHRATELERIQGPHDAPAAQRFAALLRAEVLHSRGHHGAALTALGPDTGQWGNFRPNVWMYPKAHERFLRAEILGGLGRYDDAQRWLATFPDTRAHDYMFLPGVLLRSAEFYEKAGRRDLAAAQYEKLLSLWKKAEPGLEQEIADVRERVRRLR